jgi:hypothetical protein
MNFKYIENTSITIDNEKHLIKMYNGMTGIGTRIYWIDNKKQFNNVFTKSDDLTNGNHEIYSIKWRDIPWDRIDIILHESEVPILLNDENSWREPKKRIFKS